VLDSVMVDVALRIDSLPLRGGDALAHQRLVSAGGGFNIMSAATRQGVTVGYAGQLGSGPFSVIATRSLSEEGIECLVPPRASSDIGACVVLVESTGERTFVTSPGAELTLSPLDLAAVALAPGDVVYLSGYNVVYPSLADTVVTWLEGVDDSVIVAFDPGPRVADIPMPLLRTVLARCDWLLCNNAEATYLTQSSDATDNARALFDQWGTMGVVVRDGARGCVAVIADQIIEAPGFSTNVIDTNGAGDVHNGVVLAELLAGTDLSTAVTRANAAASIAIAVFGSATCPRREEIEARVSRG
jgi:sugar/nucleoside kinase (ribokinase family)